jgi:hypothetical protein
MLGADTRESQRQKRQRSSENISTPKAIDIIGAFEPTTSIKHKEPAGAF